MTKKFIINHSLKRTPIAEFMKAYIIFANNDIFIYKPTINDLFNIQNYYQLLLTVIKY